MKYFFAVLALSFCALLSGCKPNSDHHDHAHFDGMPHNGTGVAIGDHAFHLEFVLDPVGSKMQAYVLDAHAEHYVPVEESSFELIARWDDKEERLKFKQIPDKQNPKGSYSFEAPVQELAKVKEFSGEIPEIVLQGKKFSAIKFSFPKGSVHKKH